jgi:hypothetical protein
LLDLSPHHRHETTPPSKNQQTAITNPSALNMAPRNIAASDTGWRHHDRNHYSSRAARLLSASKLSDIAYPIHAMAGPTNLGR